MLSVAENEVLTAVGPGTSAGQFFRTFWVPFLLSDALEVEGRPEWVRLLGEDLVAFRTTTGEVGLIDSVCAHRRAPLVFARNEDCALRCVYHGWKFNTSGDVVDMPAEPPGSRFKDRVKIKAYPCVERNGLIWTYMGPGEPPPLPELEFNLVPAENCHLSVRIEECNYLQALEGEIDSAHAAILHGRIDRGMGNLTDLAPMFEVARQDFGLSIAARRNIATDDRKFYWRVNQFLFPFYTLVPPPNVFPSLTGHAWVPIDDHHTLCLMFTYHPSEPLPSKTVELFKYGRNGRESGHPSDESLVRRTNVFFPMYWPKYNRENDYLFDYQLQKTRWFSGLPGLWVQDAATQSGAGTIANRMVENLGSSDIGIIQTREALLTAIQAYESDGSLPDGATDPAVSRVRAVSLVLKKDEMWIDTAQEFMRADLGSDFGYDLAFPEGGE